MKKLLITVVIGVLFTGIACHSGSLIRKSLKREPKVIFKDSVLFTAALNGCVNDIQKALDAGANVNAVNKEYATALMLAAQNGHNEAVKMLIAAGANVNAVVWVGKLGSSNMKINESHPFSVLDNARSHPDVVKTLIEAGAVSGYKAAINSAT